MQPHPLVRFSKVDKSYDGVSCVVKSLDLDIARGEFLTLLGPSGSGKTTTLMMLAGFEVPTAGTILLDGRDITHLPPHKRGIGVVFQNYALFPHMSVAENVAYPLTVRGLNKAEAKRRVDTALDMVKLGGFGGRRPAQLSGGQQQRVALARALVFEPDLVLLDEPLGALDKQLRERMQYELKQLHERLGKTMVYVTHDQSEALTMSDRIAVFDDGRIQQLAPPTELYEKPTSLFVAEFVGENNRLEGTLLGAGAGVARVKLDDGGELRGIAAGDIAAGAKVVASVRPERLVLGGEGHANRLRLTVERVVFHGDALRLVLRQPGGGEVMVKLPNAAKVSPPERGSALEIGFDVADCRIFAAA